MQNQANSNLHFEMMNINLCQTCVDVQFTVYLQLKQEVGTCPRVKACLLQER